MSFRLRILHISDLHERVAVDDTQEARKRKIQVMAASRYRVLDESNFYELIEKLCRERAIDLVCFTGDVADWGLEHEYTEATARICKILAAAGVDHQQLYVVPGNHDVARKQHEQSWTKLRDFVGRYPDPTSKWLAGLEPPAGADAAWLQAIAARTEAFWRWVGRDLGRAKLLPANSAHSLLGYRETVHIRDLPFQVHIIGLDSAWLAGDDHDARKLRLTSQQITLLARSERGAPLPGFRLALMHHPLSDLADERSAIMHLSESVDVVLHGHQHDPISEVRRDPDRSLLVFAAGSLYEGDEGDRWINSFQAIDVDLDEHGRPLRYEVRFFGWSERGHWHPSGAMYESAPQGILTIDMAKGAAALVTASHAAPPDAVWFLVPRPQALQLLKNKLIDQERPALALVGPPGAGKSTLAAELARDPDVAKAFSSGVFWITIGQERASLLPAIREILLACGDSAETLEDVDDGWKRLSKVLQTRSALLVLDDVWRAEDTAHFKRLSGSSVLITTREWSVADAADASKTPVEPLTEAESLTLFERRLERTLSPEERAQASKVAAEVGRWPLSLAAVCNRIEEGDSWQALLSDLQHEVKRLSALEVPSGAASMAAAVELSIRTLPPEDAQRFALLSLFAEDAQFTSEAAANLWHLTVEDAEQRCRVLRRKELLIQTVTGAGQRAYQLHDQHRDAGKRMLNIAPAEAHARLLAEYARNADPLSRIPDDGYIHDHLIRHIVESRRIDELYRVLCDERNGRNVWFDARAYRVTGYIDDLTAAYGASQPSLGRQLRYSLMLSSVGSLSSNVPGVLFAELVEHGIWSPERALGHALAMPPANRGEMLCLLLPKLEGRMRQRCFEALLADLAGTTGRRRVFLLSRVPRPLPIQEAERVLELAKSSDEERARAVLMGLGPMVTLGRKDVLFAELRALAAADLGSEYGSPITLPKLIFELSLCHILDAEDVRRVLKMFPGDAWLLAGGAARLGQLGELDEALSMTADLPDSERLYCLTRLAPLLREDQLDAACKAADEINDPRRRSEALAAVYARLEEPQRTERIAKLWQSTADSSVLVQYLPRTLVETLVLPDDSTGRERLIRRLAALGLTDHALDILGEPSRHLHTEFQILSGSLSEAQIVGLGLHDQATDPFIVAALLPRWVSLGHQDELSQLLKRVAVEQYALESCVERLAAHLDNDGLAATLAICTAIGDETARDRCIFELAAQAPTDLASVLLARPAEEVVEHDRLHRVAADLPPDVALRLRKRSTSPLHRLAISSALPTWHANEILDDLVQADIYMDERFEQISEVPLADWGGEYRRMRAAMDYYVRALDICPPDMQPVVHMTGRSALKHFGLTAPQACVALYPPQELVKAARSWKDNTNARAANVAALLGSPYREQLVEFVLESLRGASPSKIIEELHDVLDLPPALLDLVFRTVCGLKHTTDVHLVGLLAKAGRTTDALTVLSYIPKAYDTILLKAHVQLAAKAAPPTQALYLNKAWDQIFRVQYAERNWNDAGLLADLMPAVLAQPKPFVEALGSRAKDALSRMRRRDLYAYLGAMAPLLTVLGGAECLVECTRAAQDVARWWP